METRREAGDDDNSGSHPQRWRRVSSVAGCGHVPWSAAGGIPSLAGRVFHQSPFNRHGTSDSVAPTISRADVPFFIVIVLVHEAVVILLVPVRALVPVCPGSIIILHIPPGRRSLRLLLPNVPSIHSVNPRPGHLHPGGFLFDPALA